jgi:asparagine synthase (glutamine-hydrolysing)
MTDIQSHRGPDDRGVWEGTSSSGDPIFLGSRRLAILDLSPAGHMPMSTPDARYTIVYNGEVYNCKALRSELEAKGYRFRSHSDTEVVLYAYQEFGPNCLARLNGMFAFAIWDAQRDQLFLARDHFGIKPLYYFHNGKQFVFASEIKAILKIPDIPRRLNLTALHQYLSFLWVPDPLTLFDGILKLPAGHCALFKDGKLQVTQYWDLHFPKRQTEFPCSENDLVTQVRERFTSSVNSQMLSDVPIGAFLSAGLDSSSIVACMAQKSSRPVRTFTITFPENYRRGELHLDDTKVAKRTAAHFGCAHTEIFVEPNVVDLLPKLIWHMDEPTADPAIIMAFLVNREARKSATVLLSGVGGDEIFAGYRKYQAHYLAERYRRIPSLVRQYVLEPAIAALPSFRGTPLKGYVRLSKKMARSGSLPPSDRFLMDSIYLSEMEKHELYSTETRNAIGNLDARFKHLEYFDEVADADFLNQMLYLDVKTFMVSLNLNYNDKMSMASSVEVRVPFLDWEFAEWVAANVPPHLKLNKGTTKYILREAMRPILPAEVLTQNKAGFGAPVDYWLANELRPMVDELLSEATIKRRGLFNPKVIRRYVEEQRSGRKDWSAQIWQFLTLELWMREFLDKP